jgi:2-polyprenyl-6-methoxyphenol hydroxylase-like FAD-dependent oxidoreductase
MIFTPTLVGGESIVRLLNGRTFESEFNVPHAARAIVVGSGIAGLSAAIALLKAGCEVALYERSAVLTEVGAGISLWSNALRSLDKIGAGEAVRKHIEPLRTSEFRGKEGRVVAVSFPASALEEALGSHPVSA